MPLDHANLFPVMCLTQDGVGIPHVEQVERLCTAGASFIQLRMKGASLDDWEDTAADALDVCRDFGAMLIVNDSVDVAAQVGADGVHLGCHDIDWARARMELGPDRIVGGTVNNLQDARRAAEIKCLDYVGVGPLRFTSTKHGLSPVLGLSGIRRLIGELQGIPAWAIGGIVPSDLPELRDIGAAGAALSSFLYRDGRLESNFQDAMGAWALPNPMRS